MNQLDSALKLATLAHKGQTDKNGVDYIQHPIRVAASLPDEREKVVALLHDVLEDTDLSLKQIIAEVNLSKEQILALQCLTRINNESTLDYMKRVVTSKMAIRVKLADLRDNMDVSRYTRPLTEQDVRMLNKFIFEQEYIKDHNND